MKTYSKEVNRYVLPLIATNVAQLLINQLSLHFAVNDSSVVLSGISVIQNFLFAFGGILGAFSLSFNIKGARAFAENDDQRFKDLLKSSLLLDIMIGLSFLLICLVFGKSFLRLFYGFSGDLLRLSSLYLVIMSPYILLTLLTFLLTNVLKVEKKTKPIFAIGVVSSLLDVALNYYLVPIFGIKGAAFSAIISLLVVVLAYLALVYRVIIDALKIPSTCKKELVVFGLPLTVQEILESVLFIMAFDALMGRQGLKILSIYAVISQLFSMVRLPAFMYAGAVSVFLPQANQKHESKQFMRVIYRNSYLLSAVFAVLVTLCANVFANFLSSQIVSDIVPLTAYTMLVMAATPLYESSKMLLQSSHAEKWVVSMTTVVNIASIAGLLIIQILGFQTYQSLYFIYGLSLVILSILFIKKAKIIN
ncbi:Na+-driven multidrug efflux pump [Streptococcus equinus]|uniref:Probable multidrug resistance protein NorM n=1 Tax=Streptococcus equinus TaxID=1335 RepID=A0A1H0ZGP1_STREI|nr:MATE family efflux transporter [Streptococcus equinus]SDQ26572.1 Na+-driven multidrug efflux pump [Streptococcus equinus]